MIVDDPTRRNSTFCFVLFWCLLFLLFCFGACGTELCQQRSQPPAEVRSTPQNNNGFFSKLFGGNQGKAEAIKAGVREANQHLLKQRKAPVKVEPKVFFANERTFLAWMHIAIILAGASIAILAFADESQNPGSQIYGVVMLPVAIAFIIYSMYQCKCRKRILFLNLWPVQGLGR